MRFARNLAATVALTFTLSACGGKSFEANGGASTAGSSAGDLGAAGTTGGGAGGYHAGGSGVGGAGVGGSGSECAKLGNDSPSSVSILIENHTTRLLYVGTQMVTCADVPLFQVRDNAGNELVSPSACGPNCADLMNGIGGCPAICLFPSSITLAPGETVTTQWSGLFAARTKLPAACAPGTGLDLCDRATRIQPGTFTFTAEAGTSVDCSQTSNDCNVCTPNSEGGCRVQSSLIAGAIISAETTVNLDASYGIWPTSSSGMGSSSSGASAPIRPVELIFSDD